MIRARVLGRAVATAKHPSMKGFRLLLMQALGADDKSDGDPVLVVDTLGASPGGIAVVSSDGKSARRLIGTNATPVRYATVGLEDEGQ